MIALQYLDFLFFCHYVFFIFFDIWLTVFLHEIETYWKLYEKLHWKIARLSTCQQIIMRRRRKQHSTQHQVIPSYCKSVIKMIGLMFLFMAAFGAWMNCTGHGFQYLSCHDKNNVIFFYFEPANMYNRRYWLSLFIDYGFRLVYTYYFPE